MSDEQRQERTDASEESGQTSTATKTRNQPRTRQLPPYKVLLHNDDVNEINYVVRTVMELTHLGRIEAAARVNEADQRGLSLLLVTHKERAELYVEQFACKNLTVTIEPA